MEENQEQQQEEAEVLATRNLLMSTLREMGCQPIVKEENAVTFQYQKEEFFCLIRKDVISIVQPSWIRFDKMDTDINEVYAAINKTHHYPFVLGRIILTDESEEGNVVLSSIYSTRFTPEMPFLKELLETSLRSLLIMKYNFYSNFIEA